MKKSRLLGTACTVIFNFISMSSHAALIDRGGGLIYDDVLNVTWLQDANYAQTNGDDADGRMTWSEASAWAGGLSYYDTVRNVTYDDWRLPTVSPVDGSTFNVLFSVNATTDRGYATSAGWVDSAGDPVSEMGHMYYVNLGNLGWCPSDGGTCPQAGWGPSNTGPFTNIQSELYWTGTDVESGFTTEPTVWVFDVGAGGQGISSLTDDVFAWAVRPGDVSAVPVPAAVWLFGSGLLGLIGIARKKA